MPFALRSQLLCWIEIAAITGSVVLYGWATYQRNLVWKDDLSLWSDILV
ncbi:MAG: hypothetical protein GW873_01485 [Nitrospirae bacterium]|nr:hypothetical protein [Nitrospirota bacterium]